MGWDGSNNTVSPTCRHATGPSPPLVVTRHCPPDMRTRNGWCIEQFILAKKLGGGYASTVHLAICRDTGLQVAIKMYHRCKLSQLNNYQVKREIRIHSCLDHSNVLQLFAAFEDQDGIYLVTEYASKGDVFGELQRRKGSMSERDAVRGVVQPFLSALHYLHSLNIIHRDIKPENLLLSANGTLKVADFGLSIDITHERPVTRVGTLDYMAPEVVVCPDKVLPSDNKEKTHLHYTSLVDAWAVGVLAYELIVGRAPFEGANKRATVDHIMKNAPGYPPWTSESARHFITWALTKEAARRPNVQQLMKHPWITSHTQAAASKAFNRAESCHQLLGSRTASQQLAAQARQQQQRGAAFPPTAEGSSSSWEEDEGSQAGSCDRTNSPMLALGCSSQDEAMPDATAATGCAHAAAEGPLTPPRPPVINVSAAAGYYATAALQVASHYQQQQQQARWLSKSQSTNNVDGLRQVLAAATAAAAPQLPPQEPSYSCFLPGGRLHHLTLRQQQQQQQQGPAPPASPFAVSAVAGPAIPAPPATSSAPQRAPHDSVSSLASISSQTDLCSKASLLQRQQTSCALPGAVAVQSVASMGPNQLLNQPSQVLTCTPGGNGSSSAAVARSDSCYSLQGSKQQQHQVKLAQLVLPGSGSQEAAGVSPVPSPMAITPNAEQLMTPVDTGAAASKKKHLYDSPSSVLCPPRFSGQSADSAAQIPCGSPAGMACSSGSSSCSSTSSNGGGSRPDQPQQQQRQYGTRSDSWLPAVTLLHAYEASMQPPHQLCCPTGKALSSSTCHPTPHSVVLTPPGQAILQPRTQSVSLPLVRTMACQRHPSHDSAHDHVGNEQQPSSQKLAAATLAAAQQPLAHKAGVQVSGQGLSCFSFLAPWARQ